MISLLGRFIKAGRAALLINEAMEKSAHSQI